MTNTARTRIAVLGAGSWGTALAIHLANAGNDVMLWGRTPEHIQEMNEKRVNTRYLPGITLPNSLTAISSLKDAVSDATLVIIAVPSHAFADLLETMNKPTQGLVWLTKGLDPSTHSFLSTLVVKKWGESYPVAVVSGPSFAKELANHLPTLVTLAGNNLAFQKSIQNILHHQNLRVYISNDLLGVQLCGAVKNVLAIACGISDGLGYGANAKAALITRGLAEMSRLGTALGAKEETFIGLAGVGDLVLTCTDDQSRNRRFGLLVVRGSALNEAEKEIGQVVEGKHNATQVAQLARQFQVEMPICFQIEALLNQKVTPKQAAHNLMSRAVKEEFGA